MMNMKTILGVVLVPALLLLVPGVAMQFSDEVNWGIGDFAIAWLLMTGIGFAYQLARQRSGDIWYRAAAGLALAASFLLIWSNLAVGILGSEDNPVNRLYFGVLAVGIIGAGLARFEAQGMVRVLVAMALAQALVPVIALTGFGVAGALRMRDVIGVNGIFILLFVGSALLFRLADLRRRDAGEPRGRLG